MTSITPLSSDFKGQELKYKLLECLDKEAKQFADVARNYFDKEQFSKEDKTALLRAVVNAIDHVIAGGDWDTSLFLRNTIKPLVAIKNEAQAELDKLQAASQQKAIKIAALSDKECEVYISLFQSDGYNINKWAMQLRTLDRYVVGRPVYQQAADVEKRIRLRSALGNEAYVAVAVQKTDVLSADVSLKDQFDHALLSLKETALRNGRILAFVHQGVRYYFVDGQLIRM